MRKLLAALLFLFLIGNVAGEVQYSIQADKNTIAKNSTISMECSNTCPGLTWTLSPNEMVLGVRDGKGQITDYEVVDGNLKIPGRRFTGQERVIELRTRINRYAEEIHDGLHKRTLQLSGFKDEKTTGTIKAKNLASGRVGFGFEMSFSEDEMRFRGEGPVNTRIKFGDGYETRYFSFFSAEPEDTGLAYEVAVGTTGLVQEFERFPVAVMDDDTYDIKVNSWSSGEYVSGAIQIRNQESIEKDFLPVLSHEVVHGLNDRKLNWDNTRSTYFDEGIGKYVEFLVKKKLEGQERTRELFGDDVSYKERKNGKLYRYTLPSKGDEDQLWGYYRRDQDFMKHWNAMSGGDPETRKFGYAYSELIIRNYIARMNGSLRELYREIDVDRQVENPDVKWQLYSEHLDMTPCKYDSRERFEECLDTINKYDYPVYSAEPVRSEEPLKIDRLKVPNRSQSKPPTVDQVSSGEATLMQFLQGFIDYLGSMVSSVFQALAASV